MARGRVTAFPKPAVRVHGWITREGAKPFEAARRRLAWLMGRKPDVVSDGNTVEFLARGEADTIAHLRKTGKLSMKGPLKNSDGK